MPHVSDWIEVVGTITTKKTSQDQHYFANVVTSPKDSSGADNGFSCQFYKRTPAGTHVLQPRTFWLEPGSPENYRWRTIPASLANARGHFFI
ncbi:hypothetical protein ElyMa_001009200 [Elysia marginata]|uniref:Uncharacterized protein n=1 Tax=Elysia marginata TaxID=1093978 RepID=A0AAV4HMW7_9GAST|nr:hypothetical protein ElyMa_001009200 [Elysia marginata]